MDPVQTGFLMPGNKPSGTYIGAKHTFLNDTMRCVARPGGNTLDSTLLGKLKLQFSRIKINRVPLFAECYEGSIQVV